MTAKCEVLTFGCRLNSYESEVIRSHLAQTALSDAVVINSCAVTAEAERQVRQTIRRLHRERPQAQIIVTGCAAQINPARYAEMPEVSAVLGNQEKMEAESYARLRTFEPEASDKARVNDIMSVRETAAHLIHGMEGQSRAFIQVQNGCNHRCTFCVIPYGRGNSRSVPVGAIAEQVRLLVKQGYAEIVMTGVDIGDYGKDLPGQPTLGQMLRRVLTLVPELPRLRLSSIDAVEVDEELYRLLAEEPRLMPHLHLSLQAGDDMVLKRMKRRHLRADILAFCERVRQLRPDIVFGADIIAGFPTETEDMFRRTLSLVEEAGLTYLHVFPYSPRPDTPAARMPQVPNPLRKERAQRLREAGERALAHYLAAQVGSIRQVLVEKGREGHTEHFAPAVIDGMEGASQTCVSGRIMPLRITRADAHRLYGEPCYPS